MKKLILSLLTLTIAVALLSLTGQTVGASSIEMQEMIQKRLREEMASGAISSISVSRPAPSTKCSKLSITINTDR